MKGTEQRLLAKELLRDMENLLDSKAEDYATEEDTLSNFRFTGGVLAAALRMGVQGTDLAFLALISTKLARLLVLLPSTKKPHHESVRDTFVDLANYVVLWAVSVIEREDY